MERLAVIALLLVACACAARSDSPPGRVLIGAIRWDAWQDDMNVRPEVERALSPASYHWQAPWFAHRTDDGRIEIPLVGQDVMDQEIAYAARAGIDYWAFCTYPEEIGMSRGLRLYLASEHRDDVRFCLQLQGSWLGGRGDWEEQVERYVGYFGLPNYQRVLGDRPLVFCYGGMDNATAQAHWGGWDGYRRALDDLRAASVDAGCGDPYMVAQTVDHEAMQRLGFDALSDYAIWHNASVEGSPYAQMTATARARWEAYRAQGAQVVPLASAGWDERPRAENTPPWVAPNSNPRYCIAPDPEELADHIEAAVQWVTDHHDAAPAGAILVYAWNEHDEGGWLCPTLGVDGAPDASRVDALSRRFGGTQ